MRFKQRRKSTPGAAGVRGDDADGRPAAYVSPEDALALVERLHSEAMPPGRTQLRRLFQDWGTEVVLWKHKAEVSVDWPPLRLIVAVVTHPDADVSTAPEGQPPVRSLPFLLTGDEHAYMIFLPLSIIRTLMGHYGEEGSGAKPERHGYVKPRPSSQRSKLPERK